MRRRLLIAFGVLLALLLIALSCLWMFYGRIGKWVVREKVLPRIERKLGRSLKMEKIDVARGTITLHGVSMLADPMSGDKVEPLFTTDSIIVSYDYHASWLGKIDIKTVTVSGLRVKLVRDLDGKRNFDELLLVFQNKANEQVARTSKAGHFERLRPETVRLIDAEFQFLDDEKAIVMHASGVSAIFDRSQRVTATLAEVSIRADAGQTAQLHNLIVNWDLSNPLGSAQIEIGDGEVRAWKDMSLTKIAGTVEQGDNPEQLVVDLSGSYGGSTETLWNATGWLNPKSKQGQLTIEAKEFYFERIASILQNSMVKDFNDTSLDTEFVIEFDGGKVDISGHFDISNLNLHHEKLSEKPMKNISFKSQLVASLDVNAKEIKLVSFDVESKGVQYGLSGRVALANGKDEDGTVRQHPRLQAHFIVPKASCQKVLNSIPREFLPKLKGFELGGDFDADIVVEVDWSNIEESTVLDGHVGLRQCRVLSPPKEFDTKRLMGSFYHQILVGPEEYESVEIGLVSDDYVQIFDISSVFLNALMTQEDSGFNRHRGFIISEFRSALVHNLEAGRFKFGASSITMQMVKNVFLYRDKTISRKIQELFLTWYVEGTLDKNRIMEIYVNAIEYGPGVYGIVQAARIYFDKHPREIEPIEAAFLAHLLPRPRVRYFQYCKDKMKKRWENKMGRILKNMHKRGRLTDAEYEVAAEATIEFNPEKDPILCKKLPNW